MVMFLMRMLLMLRMLLKVMIWGDELDDDYLDNTIFLKWDCNNLVDYFYLEVEIKGIVISSLFRFGRLQETWKVLKIHLTLHLALARLPSGVWAQNSPGFHLVRLEATGMCALLDWCGLCLCTLLHAVPQAATNGCVTKGCEDTRTDEVVDAGATRAQLAEGSEY